MSDYYNKSLEYKNNYQTTVDDVQSEFLNKVSNNIGELDSRDQDTLLGKISYTQAVGYVNTANETDLPKLNNMSAEGAQNPMNPIVETDRQYAQKFGDFSSGKRSEDIKAQVEAINFDIELTKQVNYWLSVLPGGFEPSLVKEIEKLLKTNPQEAFKKLYSSESFWKKVLAKEPKLQEQYLSLLQKLEEFPGYAKYAKEYLYNNEKIWNILYSNEKLQNILFAFVGSKQAIEAMPAKIAEKLYNSSSFFDNLAKAPEWIQTRALDLMASAEDGSFWSKMVGDGSKLSGFFSKVSSTLQKVQSGKFMTAVSKLIKSPLAKKIANNPVVKKLMGPWGGIIIDSGFSAFQNYNDPKDGAYHSIGKSVIGGTIDSIKNASYLDGVLIGAELGMGGGVAGMVIGGAIGFGAVAAKNILGYFVPDWDTKLKDGAYSLYDKVADSQVGQAISSGVSKVKNTAGQAIRSAETIVKNAVSDTISSGKKIIQNIFSTATKDVLTPNTSSVSLGWFS